MPMLPDPPVDRSPDHLSVLAGQVRALGEAEARLYELCGRWSAEGDEPAARSFFASQSSLHAWRAEEWRRRQPSSALLDEVPATGLLLPGGWEEVLSRSGHLRVDLVRLTVWLDLLVPALLVAVRRCQGGLGEVADGGAIRLARIVGDDLLQQWWAGQWCTAEWAEPDGLGAAASTIGELLPVLWTPRDLS
jgi:hypothetical protein